MNKLRKAFTISLMLVTVFAMSVVVAPEAGAAQAGDLIKMDGLSSVYFLAGDGKRYVFPNEKTYFSWYSGFSEVVTVPQSELESYPLGANVTVRPGTKLVKITTNPNVYAVEPNGNLVLVPDEATAEALYGEAWAARIIDVPDAFFTNYTVTGEELASTVYPEGALVKFGEDTTIYYIDGDGKGRAIADEAAFLGNRFSWDDIILSDATAPEAGDPITGAESGLTDTSSGAGGTAGAGTGLTVAISGDTPAAGNVPGNSPVNFLLINLTAANDGDVLVNSIKLRAYDLGDPTKLESVTILDNGVKQGTSKNVNSDKEATFNFSSPIVVAAGTTKTLTVRATVVVTTGNFALGIKSASDIITNGAVVSGSFPIISNTKAAVDGSASVGTITLSSVTEDLTAAAEFGEDNVLLAGFSLAAANEAVIWESATFKNIGTNNDDIVSNMRVEVDGDVVVEGVGVSAKYAVFNLGNLVIAKGDTVTVEIYGDAGVASANNTIHFVIEDSADFSMMGQDTAYGAVLSGFGDLNQSTEGVKVTLAAADFTIDMDKATTPARDVRAGTDNVVLATIKMTSNGENATVDAITESGAGDFHVSGTNPVYNVNEVINFELKDVDSGTLFDLTSDASTTLPGWTLSLTDDIQFVKGVTRTFELRADLQGPNDTNGIDDNDTLKVTLGDGAFTITGDSSSADLSTSPTSVVSAVATVKAASLTWTTTALTAKTVVPQASDIAIYQASLKVGASSDVTLTSVRIDADDTANFAPFKDSNFASIDLYIDDKLAKSNAKIVNDGANNAYINFTALDSVARVVKAGETVTLVVKATYASSFSPSGTMALELAEADSVVARDVDSNTFTITVANALTDSRVLTLSEKGTLKVELKIDDQKANNDAYLLAGSETTADRYLGELVFTTANEDIKVKTLSLAQYGTASDSDVLAVNLYDADGILLAQEGVNANGHVIFDTFDYVFSADQATSLFIGATTKTINADGDNQGTATHGTTVQYTIASTSALIALGKAAGQAVEAIGVNSGLDIAIVEDTDNSVAAGDYASWKDATTTTATITGSVLNSIVNTLDDGVLTSGNGKTIGEYKFVFDNGTNRTAAPDNTELKAELAMLNVTVASSSVTSITGLELYVEGDAVNVISGTASSTIAGVWDFDLNAASGLADNGLVDGEVTLIITANISGVGSSGAFVQTEITDLNGPGYFIYNGNNGTGTDFVDTLLDIIKVTGGTLSN